MLRTLIAATMLATFSLAATDADAKKRSGSSSSSRDKPSAAKKKDDDEEKIQAKKAQQNDDAGITIRINSPRSSSQSPTSNQSSLQPAGPSGMALPAAAAMPAGAAAARDEEELKRKRAEELAALQSKLDAQLAGRRRDNDVKNAEAAGAAEQRQREQQDAARAAQAQREREMRRAKVMSGPPTCVIKPVMSNADLAKCRR